MKGPDRSIVVDEGTPILRAGDRWLLFLYNISYDRNVNVQFPDNVFKARSHEALKLENGQLYGLENFDKSAERFVAPHMKIKGLPLEEFKQLYVKPR